jgi:hypothetical protein
MKATLFLLFAISIFAFTILTHEQPKPLIEQNITFQPIVENIELGRGYWYIRTIKVYYTDALSTPISLSNGDTLSSYCTDSTSVAFISNNDTIIVYSVKRMSCVILAVINLNDTHISFLRNNALKRAVIHNLITDNVFNIEIKDSTYFKRVLKAFEGK